MKKCTACGCEDLKKIKIISSEILATHGYVEQTVDSYVCTKCGHVELYAKKENNKQKEFVFR